MEITPKLNSINENDNLVQYKNLVAKAKNTAFPVLAKLQYILCIMCILGMVFEGANIYIALLAGISFTSALYIQLNKKLNSVIELIQHTHNNPIKSDS